MRNRAARPVPDDSMASRIEARVGRLFLRRQMALAALAGVLAALGHAPFNLWPLALVGFAALYGLFRTTRSARHAALIGWAGAVGYFALSLVWILEPFMVDAARDGWMAPFALLFMAAGLALFWGGAFAVARAVGGHATRRSTLAWIAALAGAELLRSYIFTGFPWALVGYVLAPSPLAQIAAFFGSHGLSLVTLAIAVALWHLAGWPRRNALMVLAAAGLAAGFGVWQSQEADMPADAPMVRLIQPNAQQHEKWDPDHIHRFFNRQLEFTAAPASGAQPDIIIWPETAIPWLLENAETPLAMIADAAAGRPVVLGLRRLDGARLYNTLVLLGADGQIQTQYDKHHLVPFGEYMPFGDLLADWGIHGLAAGEGNGYSAGPGPELIDLPGIGAALPLICYEAVFPQDVSAAPARSRVLLQITNDAWFGRFSGPFQHMQQARMRAIEQGLPMIRAANTGVSAMIGPRGQVHARIPLGEAGYVDTPLPAALPATLYARIGDWGALLIILSLMIAAYLPRQK